MTINKNLLAATAGLGLAVAGLIQNPAVWPTIGAAAGGSVVSLSLLSSKKDKERIEAERAAKVSKALSYCYENFKGLVSPQQLAFHAELELEQADRLLESLVAPQNGGQRIDTPMGAVYSFDHPEQVLTQLSQNAQAWADSQTQEVIKENAVLKQQVQWLSSAVQARQLVPTPPAAAQETFKNNNDAPSVVGDPWKNML
jgi:hypothetical protein